MKFRMKGKGKGGLAGRGYILRIQIILNDRKLSEFSFLLDVYVNTQLLNFILHYVSLSTCQFVSLSFFQFI